MPTPQVFPPSATLCGDMRDALRPAFLVPIPRWTSYLQSPARDFSGGVKLEGTYSFDPSQPDQIYCPERARRTHPRPCRPTARMPRSTWDSTARSGTNLRPVEHARRPRLDPGCHRRERSDDTTLTIDDEGSATRRHTYRVTQTRTSNGSNAQATIDYSSLGQFVLKVATPEANTIHVFGTASGTTTTIDAGAGNNTVAVCAICPLARSHPRPTRPSTAAAGQDPLTIDDSGDGKAQQIRADRDAARAHRLAEHRHRLQRDLQPVVPRQRKLRHQRRSPSRARRPGSPWRSCPAVARTTSGLPARRHPGAVDLPVEQGTKTFAVLDTTAKESDTYVVSPDEITRTARRPSSSTTPTTR